MSTSYPVALNSFASSSFQSPFIETYTTPEISFGVSTLSFTKATTFLRPIFPIKYPCSNTTFCLALVFRLSSYPFLAPISRGVYNTIPNPTLVLFSIFSIIV